MLKINPPCLIKFALLAVMLTGCQPYTGTNVITPSVGPAPSVTPGITVEPGITVQPPTISPPPKDTESPTATDVDCEPTMPQAIATHGYLIATGKSDRHFSIFDLSNMKVTDRLREKVYMDSSIYADALAYLDILDAQNSSVVVVREGSTETIPIKSDIRGISWNNNYTLILRDTSDLGQYTLFLNTQTHEIRKLETKFEDYPYQYHLDEVAKFGGWNFGIPYFNATRDFALYPTEDFKIKLIHIPDLSVLRTIDISPGVQSTRWSPKGDALVYAGPELTLISTDNQQEELTDFGSDSPNFLIYSNYSWSPDGSKVAFWVTFDPYPGESAGYLSFVDITSKTVKITCFLSYDSYDEFSPIIWSPDGRQVAVKVSAQEDDQIRTVYFMDIETFAYMALDYEDELYLGGWLSFRP
jgi:hypothetical protein